MASYWIWFDVENNRFEQELDTQEDTIGHIGRGIVDYVLLG